MESREGKPCCKHFRGGGPTLLAGPGTASRIYKPVISRGNNHENYKNISWSLTTSLSSVVCLCSILMLSCQSELDIEIENILSDVIIVPYDKRDLGDGSLLNIHKCSSKRCIEFCPRFLPVFKVYSTITGRYINCINEDSQSLINCHSVNVIYVITCATCHLQYVGQTCSDIGVRFGTHRANMKGRTYSTSCKRLAEHFTSGRCKGSEYFVQIVEKMSGNGRLASGEIDLVIQKERKRREDEWMLKLRTVYPYGLNDSLNTSPNLPYASREGIAGVVGKLFPALPRNNTRVVRSRNRRKVVVNADRFLDDLKKWLSLEISTTAFHIRSSLSSMNKKNLKTLALKLHEFLSDVNEDFMYHQWYRMALDLIETKMYKIPKTKPTKKAPKYKVCLPFVNKALDFINLSQVLRCQEIKSNMPHLMDALDIPMVVYFLKPSIRSKIFNYKKFVKNLNLTELSLNPNSIPCYCNEYDNSFIDSVSKHVLSGDLNIVSNNKLKKLLSKGPKYREPEKINWTEARNAIEETLECFIEKLSDTKGVSTLYFQNWKYTIMTHIDNKILHLSSRLTVRNVHNVLSNIEAKNELSKLQNHFILVPTDKAANNISFVCKQYYANCIKSELKYTGDRILRSAVVDSQTYERINDILPTQIIDRHAAELKKYGLEIKEEQKSLPLMYGSPKLHKTPVGMRYIIASKTSSLKPLLKDLTCIFKLFQKQIESFNDKNRVWSGVSGYWVIQNSEPLIDRIYKINKRKKAHSVMTFDFTTLYTKIPHNLLIEALNEIVDFCFEGGNSDAVYVNEFGAYWRNSKSTRAFNKVSIKRALKFAIENAYFQVGDMVFRQKIGIPMGSDPAPFFANLFLYVHESKFVKNLLKTDPVRARKFRHMFRFIDDLIAMNDCGEFLRSFHEIYPQEMVLKRENTNDTEANYLEMGLQVVSNIFESKLYDKRNAFKFSVVRLPYKCSNIPSKMFYATMGAEVLRIARATSVYAYFIQAVQNLLKRMKKQGAVLNGINRSLTKMIIRHSSNFTKFSKTSEEIISDCHYTELE